MARRPTHHTFQNNGAFNPVEQQNDGLIDGLRDKVGTLKSLTIDMGDEIRDQNKYLKEVDNDFDSTWGFLSSSLSRVKRLAQSGQHKHMLYLLLFSLFVFFIIYAIIRFR